MPRLSLKSGISLPAQARLKPGVTTLDRYLDRRGPTKPRRTNSALTVRTGAKGASLRPIERRSVSARLLSDRATGLALSEGCSVKECSVFAEH